MARRRHRARAGLRYVYAGNLPGQRRRPRGHALPVVRRAARRADGYLVREYRDHGGRPLPGLRATRARAAGAARPAAAAHGRPFGRLADSGVRFASLTRSIHNRPDALLDRLGRPLRNLRLSVTDRCNLRCEYCMPEEEYVWLPREDILHVRGDRARSCDVFIAPRRGQGPAHRRRAAAPARPAGARPPARRRRRADRPRADDQRRAARRPGRGAARRPACTASRSASTRCDRDRFRALTRFDGSRRVRAGIDAAAARLRRPQDRHRRHPRRQRRRAGGRCSSTAATSSAEVRFIEYMDVGGRDALVAGRGRVRAPRCSSGWPTRYGPVDADRARPPGRRPIASACPTAPRRHHLVDDRRRSAAPAIEPADRRRRVVPVPVRAGRDGPAGAAARRACRPRNWARAVERAWRVRADRGAELRLAERERVALPAAPSRADPHLEMHTKGG